MIRAWILWAHHGFYGPTSFLGITNCWGEGSLATFCLLRYLSSKFGDNGFIHWLGFFSRPGTLMDHILSQLCLSWIEPASNGSWDFRMVSVVLTLKLCTGWFDHGIGIPEYNSTRFKFSAVIQRLPARTVKHQRYGLEICNAGKE